jgi:hypothetical protein
MDRSSCNISGDDTSRRRSSNERGYRGDSQSREGSNNISNNINGVQDSVPNGESNGTANNNYNNQSPNDSIGQNDSDYIEGDSVADDPLPIAPQINSTISCPIQGIALIKLVITVASAPL